MALSISVINFSSGLEDREVQHVLRAVNRQIGEDFASIWGAMWELRLHASTFDPADEATLAEDPVRGAAVLYLVDEATLPGALGYHALNTSEIPYGFVYLVDPGEWTVTLSHEALELIIDPTANVLVPGPDPRANRQNNVVLHAYEVCDAVERTSYEIDHVRVSNFITPQWFFPEDAPGTRNDFLGVGVDSFGATPGSHLAFLDLNEGWQVTYGAAEPPLQPRLLARQEMFQHDRPRLKDETKAQAIIEKVRSNPPEALRARFDKKRILRGVDAITRTGRKQHAALRLPRASR